MPPPFRALLLAGALLPPLLAAPAWGQPPPSPPPPADDAALHPPPEEARRAGVRPERLALVLAPPLALSALELDHRRRNWWRGADARFRVQESWGDSRGSDKAVHFFATASAARAARAGFRWAGLSEREAEAYGALAGWTQFLYLEVLDGFGPNWGFSPSDVAFNTAGAAFAYGQWRVPHLQAYELKVSYWPSGEGGRRLTADHAGQTWWLTANPHLALPGPLGEAMPPWLNVAVGYGARRGEGTRDFTESEVLLGLDLELRGLPIDHPAWDAFAEVFRYLHLPAPAVRLTPRPALVLLAY